MTDFVGNGRNVVNYNAAAYFNNYRLNISLGSYGYDIIPENENYKNYFSGFYFIKNYV